MILIVKGDFYYKKFWELDGLIEYFIFLSNELQLLSNKKIKIWRSHLI